MTGFTPIDPPADGVPRRRTPREVMEARSCVAVVINMADVQPQSVAWLWRGRFARGKVTLLAGDPGLGKSFVTLDMAARVSAGTAWPDAPDVEIEPGGVVLLSAEDDAADTIRPRLDAMGADVSRVNLIRAVRRRPVFDPDREAPDPVESPFDLTCDLPALEEAIAATANCALVVIDPITAYLGGTDSHKNAELRGLLAPLADLAARYGVAIVAVTHHNKSRGGPAIHRAMGSLAFVAAARAAWAVVKDTDDPFRRLILPVKNNLAPDVGGLAYRIETVADGAAVVTWEPDPVEMSADDALGAAGDERGDDDDVADFLRETLRDGEMPAADVLRQADENRIGDKALRRVFKAIGGKRRREGFGRGGTWYWSLPPERIAASIDAIDPPSQSTGINGNNDDDPAGIAGRLSIIASDLPMADCIAVAEFMVKEHSGAAPVHAALDAGQVSSDDVARTCARLRDQGTIEPEGR